MSTSVSTSAARTLLKWDSPICCEDTFESEMSKLRTAFIKSSVMHCLDKKMSNLRLAEKPDPADVGSPTYPARMAAYEKTFTKLNDESSEAMGTLLDLFDPDCNAHRSLEKWYNHPLI